MCKIRATRIPPHVLFLRVRVAEEKHSLPCAALLKVILHPQLAMAGRPREDNDIDVFSSFLSGELASSAGSDRDGEGDDGSLASPLHHFRQLHDAPRQPPPSRDQMRQVLATSAYSGKHNGDDETGNSSADNCGAVGKSADGFGATAAADQIAAFAGAPPSAEGACRKAPPEDGEGRDEWNPDSDGWHDAKPSVGAVLHISGADTGVVSPQLPKRPPIVVAASEEEAAGGGPRLVGPGAEDPPSSPDDAIRSTTPPDHFQVQPPWPPTQEAGGANPKSHRRAPSFTADGFVATKLESPERSGAGQGDGIGDDHGLGKLSVESAASPGRESLPRSPLHQTQNHCVPLATASARAEAGARPYHQLGTVGLFSSSYTGRTLTFLSDHLIPARAQPTHSGAAFAGFLSLLLVTCASYMLSPMRDAAALAVGVNHIPALTLASTVLALASSVPVGWLFEAPDPARRGRIYNRMGLTRGETQGTSLALFYRCFALSLVGYAIGFKIVEILGNSGGDGGDGAVDDAVAAAVAAECPAVMENSFDAVGGVGVSVRDGQCIATLGATGQLSFPAVLSLLRRILARIVKSRFGKTFYVAFFLVVHLMKLHSLSLIWGVTSEAMEYEEQAEKRERKRLEDEAVARVAEDQQLRRRHSSPLLMSPHRGNRRQPVLASIPSGQVAPADADSQQPERTASTKAAPSRSLARLKRLSFVGFGGTIGGILGSVMASTLAGTLHLSGLLFVSAIFLELSAELSIELGKIMLRHWQEEQHRIQSCGDLASLSSGRLMGSNPSLGGSLSEKGEEEVDSSMKRVASLGSMKRIASGNSISSLNRTRSAASLNSEHAVEGVQRGHASINSLSEMGSKGEMGPSESQRVERDETPPQRDVVDENTFRQRLLRGIKTILKSRLLMCIFTYNALAASTSVLLSFQRAELVANRATVDAQSSAERDTAFLANVNIASSVAVFALQVSGLGAFVASSCGQYGTLILMPTIRMLGLSMLAWWHVKAAGQPPNLTLFLLLDEFTKVINFAVAKPVRESLWRGLSPEARYEAKPIVDTLANRWGGGSAAFLTSSIGRIMVYTGIGHVMEDGTRTIFGFPPILILCAIAAAWWTVVSVDLGGIRRSIDAELKKQL